MKRSCLMPFGAELTNDGVRFRVWAPHAHRVDLCLEDQDSNIPLDPLDNGWFALTTTEASAGSLYKFQFDGGLKVPDPASRFQPQDVHGPSEVIDPRSFDWQDTEWSGRPWEEAIVYELHVGTFTPEGTFRGVEQKLDYLLELGVTAIELMPLADFPGKRGWGYDGVLPFAPDGSYGRPNELKHLIQAAHVRGLMVFIDVVYNHFGPEGNYLHASAPQFFTSRHRTPWGDAINFGSRPVRDFFISNALYWLDEYYFDGLRLDAVHAISDDSTPDILTELAQTVRGRLGPDRHVHLILENADNQARYLRQESAQSVPLYTAQWNDDIHHALHVLVTNESDGYYSDYSRKPLSRLCRCLTEGFAFQGDYSEFHSAKRGETSSDLTPCAFISFLQNHDQVGNRAFGERIVTLAPAQTVQAAIEIVLLAPAPPMLFMGEEFGATTPFLFFCDFHGDLAAAVTKGRRSEFAPFEKFNSPEVREQIPDPNAISTFLNSKLDWESLDSADRTGWLNFYRGLLSLRKRVVIPLLRDMPESRRSRCDDGNRTVSVDWEFPGGIVLGLRANLSNERAEVRPARGHKFYSSSADAGVDSAEGAMEPWSVSWSLAKSSQES